MIGTIGMLGSIAFAVNSLTGPAMLNLPHLYQKSGFIPTTVTLALLCILSTLCSLHLANVISAVPGNSNFHREVNELL
jgi:amino acid permease